MPVYERLSMVVSFILIGLALYFIIDLPARVFHLTILNQTLTITASQRLLMVILLGGLAFTGSGAVIRAHPQQRVSYTVPFWVNATLIVVLATLLLVQAGNPIVWAMGLFATGLLLWFTILAEYYVVETQSQRESQPVRFKAAQLWSQWVSYTLLAIYAILLKEAQVTVMASLIGLFSLSWLLAASIFKLHRPEAKNKGVWGFLVALTISQVSWVLTYWPLNPTSLGLLILLLFYALCGLISNHLQGKLSRRIVLEYGLVAVIGVGLVVQLMR